MPDEEQCIYGDGAQTVAVSATAVEILDGDSRVSLSRAAFREIVLAWQRFLAQEQERGE